LIAALYEVIMDYSQRSQFSSAQSMSAVLDSPACPWIDIQSQFDYSLRNNTQHKDLADV